MRHLWKTCTLSLSALTFSPSKDKIAQNHVAYTFPNFHCSVVSLGSNRPNQDNFVVSENVLGVLDGHGDLGHEVSTFLSSRLQASKQSLESELKQSEENLRQKFSHLDLVNYPDLLTRSKYARKDILRAHSGSTVCLGTVQPIEKGQSRWNFANLGDSQAIYVHTKTNTLISLTKPESIQNKEEQEKLFNAHPAEKQEHLYQRDAYVLGRVQPTSVIGDFHLKESLLTIQTLFDPVVGKNNTHASGYYLTPPYLRSEPTMTQYELQLDSHSYIIFATDGFWDRVTPEEVKEKLKETRDKGISPAAQLAEYAMTKPYLSNNKHSTKEDWNIIRSCFSKNFRDDLTVLVVSL